MLLCLCVLIQKCLTAGTALSCGVVLLLGNKEEKVSLLATFVVKYSNLVQGFGVFCLWKLFKNGKALLVFGIWKLMTNTNSAFTAGNNHICCRSCSYMLNLEGLILKKSVNLFSH